MNQYYVDIPGNNLGSFGEGTELPIGAIKVPVPPSHGTDTWNGVAWIPNPERVKLETSHQADVDLSAMLPEAVAMLVAWAEKTATGVDKTALKTMLDKINAEKAKKK